jgi:hypothetical protein
MLTPGEFEQLKAAIQCMHVYNINDRQYIDAQNMIAILYRWTEGWKPQAAKPHPESMPLDKLDKRES